MFKLLLAFQMSLAISWKMDIKKRFAEVVYRW